MQDSCGKTPILDLVRTGSIEMIKLFLDYNADVHIETYRGESPLFIATRRKDVEILQLLVDKGAVINKIFTEKGLTPLHLACELANNKVIKCLLKNGADINAFDSKGYTPLQHFLEPSYDILERVFMEEEETVKTLEFLLKYTGINAIMLSGKNIFVGTYSECLKLIILQHIAKLQAMKITVHPELLDITSERNNEYNPFTLYYIRCKDELLQAKNTRLHDNSWVNYFDLLVGNKKNLENYAGNEGVVKGFRLRHCEEIFPIYGASMRKRFEKGIFRRELFDKAAILLSDCIPNYDSTHLIIRDTLDYLSTKDLLIFCA